MGVGFPGSGTRSSGVGDLLRPGTDTPGSGQGVAVTESVPGRLEMGSREVEGSDTESWRSGNLGPLTVGVSSRGTPVLGRIRPRPRGVSRTLEDSHVSLVLGDVCPRLCGMSRFLGGVPDRSVLSS